MSRIGNDWAVNTDLFSRPFNEETVENIALLTTMNSFVMFEVFPFEHKTERNEWSTLLSSTVVNTSARKAGGAWFDSMRRESIILLFRSVVISSRCYFGDKNKTNYNEREKHNIIFTGGTLPFDSNERKHCWSLEEQWTWKNPIWLNVYHSCPFFKCRKYIVWDSHSTQMCKYDVSITAKYQQVFLR